MGMSASQARYLGLVARQNNIEYQGQQINQERSILSQQVTTLYNTLLAMQVPTPPSTSDYTTIEYTGSDGASTFTLGTVKPSGSKYQVELLTQSTGDSLAARYGTASVVETHGKILGDPITDDPGAMTLSETSAIYVLEDGSVRKASPTTDLRVEDGKYYLKAGTSYVKASINGHTEYTDFNASGYTIEGQTAYTWEKAKELYGDMLPDFDKYRVAIENKYGTEEEQQTEHPITPEESFYIYFTYTEAGRPEPHFALKTDVEGMDQRTVVYDYTPNGSFTKAEVKDHCQLTFDTTGRITSIDIPYYNEGDPDPAGYTTISLQAKTKTDEAAYQDAYAEFEYAQYLYDKQVQEINAKTEIIQQEDRNLELKLTRLDNERNQVKTEMDAVKEVIKNNIEVSYKTFSG